MPTKHFKYGGSTISRTMACPAWVSEAAKAPQLNRAGEAANRGSAMHEGLEWCIQEERVPGELLGKTYAEYGYTLDENDIEEMQIALDAANDVMNRYGITEFVTEQLVQWKYKGEPDDVGGSADLIGIGEKDGTKYRMILDWKTGYQPVRAINQGAFYDMCGYTTPDIADMYADERTTVVVTVQPKVSHEADVYEFELIERMEVWADIQASIDESRAGTESPVAGEHCQYCPARPYCPTQRAEAAKFLALDPAHSEQLAEGMELVEQMKEHIKAMEAEVFAALKNDERIPGWKLVMKQTRRYWTDEQAVRDLCKKGQLRVGDITDTSLKSVAQLEKVVKAKRPSLLEKLKEYVENKSSGVTIAKESDKRPAVPGKNETPGKLAALMESVT